MTNTKGIKVKTIIALVLLWSMVLGVISICSVVAYDSWSNDIPAVIGASIVIIIYICGGTLLTKHTLNHENK